MKKLRIVALSFGLLAAPLIAQVKKVRITLKNMSNIPITAIKKRFGCAKIMRGELTACDSVNIPANSQKVISGSKPFNVAIHHQKKGQNLRFATKQKVKNGQTLVFPSAQQFKVLKGKFPAMVKAVKPTPVAQPKEPKIAPPLKSEPETPMPAPPVFELGEEKGTPKKSAGFLKELQERTPKQEAAAAGKGQKAVAEEEVPAEKQPMRPKPVSLLEEIKQGTQLKPAAERELKFKKTDPREEMRERMRQQMEQRRSQMGIDADEEDNW